MDSTAKIDLRRGLSSLLTQLLDTQMRAGTWLANSLNQKQMPWESSCCDIPAPCWMPKNLGAVTSHVCPGATAVVRIRITNCDIHAHTYHFSTRGEGATQITLTPSSMTIPPLEKGVVTAQFTIPADDTECQDSESLILILGCNAYYLRWVIAHAKQGGDCCHEIDIEDCPDYVHHWYDHFYCYRSCFYDQHKSPVGKNE